jgi:iron complex transport system substrate-binding protein
MVTRRRWMAIAVASASLSASAVAAQAAVPERVVSLLPSVTDVIVALGAADRIVGRTDFDGVAGVPGVPSVGGAVDPNIEAMLEVRPDLVFLWDEASAPGLRERLARAGLRTHVLTVTTLGELRAAIVAVGALLAVPRRADSLVRAIDAGLDSVRIAHRGTGHARPRVFYMVWPRPLLTTGGGTYIDSLIGVAGGTNVFGGLANPWPAVSWEAVVRADPDVILWPRHAGNADPREIGPMRALRAARANRVHGLDGDLISRPGPRVVEAAREVARVLHGGAEWP